MRGNVWDERECKGGGVSVRVELVCEGIEGVRAEECEGRGSVRMVWGVESVRVKE